jgi:heptosyltransferase-1
MKILLVKTSSIGDLIHTMPAITDAMSHKPDLSFDWLVEERLAPICHWHPAIRNVITVNYRYWRKHPLRGMVGGPLSAFRNRLRSTRYDLVLDAQGLYKSAVMTAFADGTEKHGFDLASCREKLAPLAYSIRHTVSRKEHAVQRLRRLFALAIGYPMPDYEADFGIDRRQFSRPALQSRYLLCFHGSKWRTKLWPLARWRGLSKMAGQSGLKVCLPWFNAADRQRAMQIASVLDNVVTLKADLEEIGRLVAHAECVVTIETGFGHLSAAIGVPTVALYGPTSSASYSMAGDSVLTCIAGLPCSPCHNKICSLNLNARAPAPCMDRLHETEVWRSTELCIAQPKGVNGRRSVAKRRSAPSNHNVG